MFENYLQTYTFFSSLPMIVAAVVFGISYIVIASGKIPPSIVALMGATLIVLLGVIGSDEAFTHIDLNVILLLVGMMTLADIISRTGLFEWMAITGAQTVRANGVLVLLILSLITATASAFLDNVTTVVLMVPITFSLAESLGISPIPLLITEVFASNIGGTATIIGDPPNIIIASAADIGFLDFLINLTPFTLASMVLLAILAVIWFHREVRVSEDKRQEIMYRSANAAIKDTTLLWKSLAVFTLTIIGFLVHGLIDVSPAFIALGGAALLAAISRIDPRELLNDVEWNTIAFFIGLFVLVGGLVETGITDLVQQWMIDITNGSDSILSVVLIWFGGVVSGIVDNIPYTATMVPVVKQLPSGGGEQGTNPLWWALTLGADLGGNLTAIGASANVVVLGMARARGHQIGFLTFMKYGVMISLGTLLLSTLILLWRYF